MSTFDWVVLVWLILLTLWNLVFCTALTHLVNELTRIGILRKIEPDPEKKSCPPTYVRPSLHRDNPGENPFLKAGIEAVEEAKKKQEGKANG